MTISNRSRSSRRRVPMNLSQIAFALGACGGLARILMPSAVNTASKELVNWPARSLIRNSTVVARWPRSIRKLRAACVVQAPSGLAVMPTRSMRTTACGTASGSSWMASRGARGHIIGRIGHMVRDRHPGLAFGCGGWSSSLPRSAAAALALVAAARAFTGAVVALGPVRAPPPNRLLPDLVTDGLCPARLRACMDHAARPRWLPCGRGTGLTGSGGHGYSYGGPGEDTCASTRIPAAGNPIPAWRGGKHQAGRAPG